MPPREAAPAPSNENRNRPVRGGSPIAVCLAGKRGRLSRFLTFTALGASRLRFHEILAVLHDHEDVVLLLEQRNILDGIAVEC